LEKCKTFKCTALGYMRLFAQKSCDHRGTPEFPGLVLNLVKDPTLEELGYRTPELSQSRFRAMVWLVPPEHAAAVIEDLDYRERGGYHRHTITVKLDKDQASGIREDELVVQALVYTGAPDNPNFHLAPLRRRLSSVLRAGEATESDEHVEAHILPFRLHRRNVMTDTIAAAVGPSGANVDYLCNLERYLNAHNMHDPFLSTLAASVRLRLGPWRGGLHRSVGAVTEDSVRDNATQLARDRLHFQLMGWGSNEFLQLSNAPPPVGAVFPTPVSSSAVAQNDADAALMACRGVATDISGSLPAACRGQHRHNKNGDSSINDGGVSDGALARSFNKHATPSSGWRRLCEIEQRFVAAGGGTSAVVQRGAVRIWGKLVPELLKYVISGGATGSTQTSLCMSSVVLEGVHGVAIGHDHMLLLHRRHLATAEEEAAAGVVVWEDVLVAVGNDSHGQCSGAVGACAAAGIAVIPLSHLQLRQSETEGVYHICTRCGPTAHGAASGESGTSTVSSPKRILKLAAGMRHSALVTEGGELVTWGDGRYGQVLERSGTEAGTAAVWRPESGAGVVDVACGAKHTVVLDCLGAVYCLGGRQRGSEGNGVPERVEGLPQRVRWQRVSAAVVAWVPYTFMRLLNIVYPCTHRDVSGGERLVSCGAAGPDGGHGQQATGVLRVGQAGHGAVPGPLCSTR
jgi:cation transport regulator ChaC